MASMIDDSRYSNEKVPGMPTRDKPSLLTGFRTGSSLLKIDFRRSVGLLLFPLLVAVGWLLSRDVMYGDAYVWLDTSAGVRSTTIVLGPIVGGVTAWMAGRNGRRGMSDILCTTPYSTVSRDLGVWVGTALWGVGAYALLAVVFGGLSWWKATWGEPLPGYFVVGLAAMVCHSAIGYAAGYWLPSRFTAPFVAIGLFFLQFAPEAIAQKNSLLEPLSPAPNILIYREVFYEVPQLAVQQSVWLLGLAGVALATVALKAGRGNLSAWVALLGALVVALVGGFSAVGAADQRALSVRSAETVPFEYVCKDGVIEVCLHPAYEKMLPELAATVYEIAEPLSGISGIPNRAAQVSDYGPADQTNTVNTLELSTTSVKLGPSDPFFGDKIMWELVPDQAALETGAGVEAAGTTPEDRKRCGRVIERGVLLPAAEARHVVRGGLLRRVGISQDAGFSPSVCSNSDELIDRFESLEPEKRRAWLEKNFSDLLAGKVTLKDLP
ncbi:hypothetical protein BH23ACT11_BH23ACT11_19080 [soil metagenome]